MDTIGRQIVEMADEGAAKTPHTGERDENIAPRSCATSR
jgi:hypothetical protein